MPNVATDLIIEEKFLKLPKRAIPEEPKKTDTILVEIIPKRKLTPIETEFNDSTLNNVLFFKIFKITSFGLLWPDYLLQQHSQECLLKQQHRFLLLNFYLLKLLLKSKRLNR